MSEPAGDKQNPDVEMVDADAAEDVIAVDEAPADKDKVEASGEPATEADAPPSEPKMVRLHPFIRMCIDSCTMHRSCCTLSRSTFWCDQHDCVHRSHPK